MKKEGNKILITTIVAVDTIANDNILRQVYIVFLVAFIVNYYLRSSWILDNGYGIHLYNDTMKHRFKKDRNCLNS